MGGELLGVALAFFGAGLALALAGTGSCIGISYSGQAAAGVITEDPDKFGRLIPFVAMPGTQGFYGFIVFFLIVILKLNFLGELHAPTVDQGWHILFVGGTIGLVMMFSGIHQGKVAAAAIGIIAKKPEQTGKGLILPAFVETYAVVALLGAFLALNNIQL
jgi:V/A-type H+-transporting ATPase subunit K